MPLTIDADAHVIEGIPFASEALRRWPDRVKVERTPEGTPYFSINRLSSSSCQRPWLHAYSLVVASDIRW